MTTRLTTLSEWVDDVAHLTKPDRIHWCTGTDEEYVEIVRLLESDGFLTALNPDTYPNCYLHLSDPSDVARVEHLTFVCTTNGERSRCRTEQSLDESGRGARQG